MIKEYWNWFWSSPKRPNQVDATWENMVMRIKFKKYTLLFCSLMIAAFTLVDIWHLIISKDVGWSVTGLVVEAGAFYFLVKAYKQPAFEIVEIEEEE